MKQYLIIFLCIMNHLTYNASMPYSDFKQLLITATNEPTPALLTLLTICGISHDGTLENIITATQKEQPIGFLRLSDKERWQITSYLSAQQAAIEKQCMRLEMFTEIHPTGHNYDYAIIFGGVIQKVRERIAYLAQLWDKGIRWNHVIVLTGQRILDPIIESAATWGEATSCLPIKSSWSLNNSPMTETDMIKMVFEQSVLPSDWTSIQFIDTPAQLKESGLTRPNTADTILYWLTMHPAPGTIIAISSQPLIGYQDAVLKRIFPPSFTIETVGPAIQPSEVKPEILIGTIGWWLYNAYQCR